MFKHGVCACAFESVRKKCVCGCAQTALLSLTVRLLLSRKLDGTSFEAPSRFEFFCQTKLNFASVQV